MKISSINKININATNSIVKSPKTDNIANIQQKNECKTLLGIPKSYISFGSVAQVREDERMKNINLYLYYKDHKDDYAEDSTLYLDRANARIRNKIACRTVYVGSWVIPGHVFDVEREKIIKEEYDKFVAEKNEFRTVMANEEIYKGFINTNEIEVYNEVKRLLENKENSIDNKIAGYNELKKDIRNILVSPIQKESAMDIKQKIPPSILLYGPIGCGKTELANSIVKETGCAVVTMQKGTNPERFEYELTEKLKNARKYYKAQSKANKDFINSEAYRSMSNADKAKALVNMKSPRTIFIIDEIDTYLNPKTAGNSDEIADNNKTLLKGILDHCSEKPDGEYSQDASATTMIFTTNYPTKVDTEISLRGGKCTRLPVSMPSDNDIVDIIKFYLNEGNKRIAKTDDPEKKLELVDIDDMPYDRYLQLIKENNHKGALSCGGIEQVIHQAITNYISRPDDIEFAPNFQVGMLLTSPLYRTNPEKLAEYIKEVDALGKLYRAVDKEEEHALLKELKELDLITLQQLKKLKKLDEIDNIKNINN